MNSRSDGSIFTGGIFAIQDRLPDSLRQRFGLVWSAFGSR
jgi:hypothetical protein